MTFSIMLDFRWGPHTIDDLHVVIMRSFPVSIPDFINQGLKLLLTFYKIGILRTTGFFLQFYRLRELLESV